MRVDVWRVRLDQPDEALAATLSPDEQARAARFVFPHDRRRFVACRGALRAILGAAVGAHGAELRFEYGARGKPRLADGPTVGFNVAHSHDLALVAVADCELGVDLELVRPMAQAEALIERWFSVAEQAAFAMLPSDQREAAFFRGWTRKEAYLKGLGGGLTIPLRSFDVSLDPGQAELPLGGGWTVRSIAAPDGYAAALATASPGAVVRARDFTARS